MAKKKSKYSEYTIQTQNFMDAVEAFIIKKYGKIERHWEGQLQLLALNYDLFILAKERIKTDGLMLQNRFGTWDEHPLLKQVKDSNTHCLKLIHEFGLSPNALGKIKEVENNDEEDFVKSLLNG